MPCLLKSSEALKDALSSETLNVLHFAEEWAPQCEQTDIFLDYLSKRDEYSNVKFLKVHPTDLPEAASLYNVTAVPTVVLLHGTKAVDRVDGVNAKEIGEKVALHMKLEPVDLNERLKALINRNKVMLFMKGSRNEPRCGFSKQIVGILESIGATYDTFDILEDEEVRQGLKVYSEWPTYPQLYISGELIGGLDIVKEMNNTGELKKMMDA